MDKKEIEDKGRIIALQRKKIEELSKENGILKMENALLEYEIKDLKKAEKQPAL